MKKREMLKFVVVVLMMVSLSSCVKSFLDTRMDIYLTDEEIRSNRSSLWSTAYSMYSGFQSGFAVLDGNLLAGISDEAQQTARSGNVYSFTRGLISQDVNPLEYRYYDLYEGIRGALFFEDFIKDGKGMAQLRFGRDTVLDHVQYHTDIENLNKFAAESKVVRAFYYAELLKLYGGVPIVTKLYQADLANTKSKKATYDELVDYIVDLIDQNLNGLQEDWAQSQTLAESAGRIDQKMALALKSRVLLYAASPLNNPSADKKKWSRAAESAKDFLEKWPLSLPTNRNYYNDFLGNTPVNLNTNISVIRKPSDNALERMNYPIATNSGYSGLTPSQNLVEAYEYIGPKDATDPYKNRDPRLLATIVVNGSTWNGRTIDQTAGGTDDMAKTNASRTGYYLKKYLHDNLNLIQGGVTQHQWVLFRYAEIYLNYAEAMNEAFGPDAIPGGYSLSAREALMQVRNSASVNLPTVIATNVDQLRQAIKHERRVEFAFEGHRYWDLLRWKDAMTVLNKPIRGVKVIKSDLNELSFQEYDVEGRVFHERNYRQPFSRTEVTNSDGTLIQNEGY